MGLSLLYEKAEKNSELGNCKSPALSDNHIMMSPYAALSAQQRLRWGSLIQTSVLTESFSYYHCLLLLLFNIRCMDVYWIRRGKRETQKRPSNLGHAENQERQSDRPESYSAISKVANGGSEQENIFRLWLWLPVFQ